LATMPVARVPAAADPKAAEVAVKWEYKIVPFKDDLAAKDPRVVPAPVVGIPGATEMEKTLNKLGEEGWELSHNISRVGGATYPGGPAAKADPGRLDTTNYLVLRRARK